MMMMMMVTWGTTVGLDVSSAATNFLCKHYLIADVLMFTKFIVDCLTMSVSVLHCCCSVIHTNVCDCLGEKDLVLHGFECVVHNSAAGLVQFYRQSW